MKYTKITYWTVVCCSIFLLLQYAYRYHFYYIEQLQLFRFSRQYASDIIIGPGGLSLYIARFLVQFYLFPVAGALVTACLLTSASILTHRLLEKISPSRTALFVSLLPAVSLFILHTDMNYNIQGTIACLIMLITANLYVTIHPFTKRLAAGLIMAPVLFFTAGAVVSLFAIFVSIWEIIRKNPGWYFILILPAEVALTGLLALYLNRQGELSMIILPDAYYDPLIKNKTVYYAWCTFPVSLIIARLSGKGIFRARPESAAASPKKVWTVTALQLLAFFAFLLWISVNDKRILLKSVEQDYYLRSCRWDKIIETFPAERHSLQMMNVLNHALAQKNLLGYRLFDYNPQGYQSVLAEWDDTQVNAIALSDIYYHIGDIAVAQKLAFEGMVSSLNGGNVRLLQRLIETNIIFREYPVAEKYIRLLEQTLPYRKKAQYYRTFLYDDTAVENDRVLGNKRKALIKNNVYAVSNNRLETFERLAGHHAGNPLPMQYLLAICLTNKDLKTFRAILEKYFRTDQLPALSTNQQEAVIALEQDNPGFWITNGVSPGVEKRFRAFDADMTINRAAPDFKEKMRLSHGNTYWYYLLFNNIKTINANATNDLYSGNTAILIAQIKWGVGGKHVDNNKVIDIFPDYTNVTVPPNIAPLNFSIRIETGRKATAVFSADDFSFPVLSDKKGQFTIPPSKWKKLLDTAKGKQIEVAVTTEKDGKKSICTTFHIYVAEEPVDSHIAYRLIEPGYALWNRMGIYQRHLETYRESPVYENIMTGYNCVNCHSFCERNPGKMLLHLRAKHAGTVLIDGDEIDFLQTKTEQTVSPLVYPSWHPSGKFIAFSVNRTTQGLHPAQRVEVFDKASDVVVYDIEEQTVLAAPPVFSKSNFETFPSFSADGRTLYFCSGTACVMPDSIRSLRYSLCSISFDPESKTFGNRVDTLYNAERTGRSVSFPRVSPDGRRLMCTLSSYGTFPIWHKDADLYLIDLEKKEGMPLYAINSEQADSYHSWSSNSRWVVFSSRRLDGLYTRPFFAYINERGEAAKPFLLPQKNSDSYYTELMKSYNIPEFVSGEITNRSYAISRKAKDKNSMRQVKFKWKPSR